jgi:hypothetical protein
MCLRVNRSSIESSFPIHHHHITSPIFDPESHHLSPFRVTGCKSRRNIDLNAHSGVRIIQRTKMDLRALVDVTSLNHDTCRKIIGSIEKLAAFGDISGTREINTSWHPKIRSMGVREEQIGRTVEIKGHVRNTCR